MLDLSNDHILTAEVQSIEWDRIFLFLDVKVVYSNQMGTDIAPLDFYFVNGLFQAKGKAKIVSKHDNQYRLKINITNNGENRCYPLGTYSIYVCDKDRILTVCVTSMEMIERLDDYSRNFLYANRSRAYTANFFVKEELESAVLGIYLMASSRAGMGFPKYDWLRGIFLSVPRRLKSYFRNSKIKFRKYYSRQSKKFVSEGQKIKTVLFMSEQSDSLGSNLQAVMNRMIERGLDRDYELLVSARAASSQEQSKQSWYVLLRKIAKSDIIFLDDHAPVFDWLLLRDNTKLIQLWHAGAGFKSSGYSRWGHVGCPGPMSCHRQYTYGIAGSKYIVPFFSEVWGINDEQVLPTGMPRMDEYIAPEFRKAKTEELYRQFPMCKDKKVILFAPTYRGKNRKEAYYPYELIDFKGLYDLCGDEYVVLFKMHPWVSAPVPIEEQFSDKFLDVGTYPNINDLFYITDLLITDYSSNIFEYSIMRKPMLFFAFDKVQYSFSRGFHRDYEESAPGKICYQFEDVLNAIATKDFEVEKADLYVQHHFDYIDSGSSDRVIDWIILGKLPKDMKDALETVEMENQYRNELIFIQENTGEQEKREEDENEE